MPQGLIREEVADTRDRDLIEQARFHGRVRRTSPAELGRCDRTGVRPEPFDRRVEADPAEPPRVDEHQERAIAEGEREPGEPVVTRRPAALPVVASVSLQPVAVTKHDLARHAEMEAEDGTGSAGSAGAEVSHHMLFPVRWAVVAAALKGRCGCRPAVRAAYVAIGIVDVKDFPAQRGLLDDRASGLYLGQLRHVRQRARQRVVADR